MKLSLFTNRKNSKKIVIGTIKIMFFHEKFLTEYMKFIRIFAN